MSRIRNPSLKPSQIADTLQWLARIHVTGEVVRCWRNITQFQVEGWCDMEIHRAVIQDESIRRAGRPRLMPPQAMSYLIAKSSYERLRKAGVLWPESFCRRKPPLYCDWQDQLKQRWKQ